MADRTRKWAAAYGALFLLAFALSVVMLLTDSNLRTDFGRLSSGYFSHWYVVLATAIADAVGAVLLLIVGSRAALRAGVLGSGLLSLVLVGAIFTYSQVDFTSAAGFASYLFGLTYSGGDLRYLYDALLAVYLAAFAFGWVALWRTRSAPRANRIPPPSMPRT